MAQRITGYTWEVQGRTVTLPVVIRDSTVAAVVFCCSAAAARTAVGDDRLEPLTIAGRSIAVLVVVQYHDGDLGTYEEVGLMVAVRGPGHRAIGAYTLELPVTQAFTLEAGRAIWGLPKWLVRSMMTFRRSRVQVHLCEGEEFVLTAALDVGGLRIPVPVTTSVICWTVRPDGPEAGELLHGALRLRLEDLRVRPGRARLVLGEHRMAQTARALGMSRWPLCTAVARITAELGAFTPVHR
jgi:hypothetical protein